MLKHKRSDTLAAVLAVALAGGGLALAAGSPANASPATGTSASPAVREAVGITAIIARRGTTHCSGLGKYRWVVEQVRREALIDRVEVRDLRLRPVAAGR